MGAQPVPADPLKGRHGELAERLRGVHQEMVDATLAGEGIERVAALACAHVGRPVGIVLPGRRPALLWPEGPGAERLEALQAWRPTRANGRVPELPSGVELVVPISSGGEVIGSVAMLAGERDPAGDAAEFLYLAAITTVMALALEDARQDEEALRTGLVEELRSKDLDASEITRRAARAGCDLARGTVVLAVGLRSAKPREAMAVITGEYPGALTELIDDRIYAVLPARGADEAPELTVHAARGVAARLHAYGKAGISSFYTDPGDIRRAIQEAELVLEVVSSDEHMAKQLASGAGSGVYRLLFRALATHPEEVRRFYEDTVAPAVRYDDQYHSDLLPTLESYLENDCNMNATARAIYAHRHTVAYRLQRIKELTGLDPMISESRERLSLGLKAYRIVAPTLPR